MIALAVSGVGLLTAALTFACQTLPDVDAWAHGKELWFGAAVIAIVAVSFALGQRLARSDPRTVQRPGFGASPQRSG